MNAGLIEAFWLGFIGFMIPGPILSAIFTEILQSGFKKSFRTIFYALIAEAALAFVTILLFSSMVEDQRIFPFISLVGAVVLVWMSRSLWKIKSINSDSQQIFTFSKIGLLTLTNGLFATYWITVCVPKAIALNQTVVNGKYLFLGAIELGWFLGAVVLAYIFARFRPLLIKPKIIGPTFKIFALTFVYFAITMAYKGIVDLI